jgi:hypothetical protein
MMPARPPAEKRREEERDKFRGIPSLVVRENLDFKA